MKFNFRIDLFKHISQEGHIVASDDEGKYIEHINSVAGSRGRKKTSRSIRKYNQLYIHRNQNIEEVDNIDEWMTSHGWSKNESTNHWMIDGADILSLPTAPFGFVKS